MARSVVANAYTYVYAYTHTYIVLMVCCICLCSNGRNDIGRYYEGNGSNVYYLNNFDSLSQSYGESFTKDDTNVCLLALSFSKLKHNFCSLIIEWNLLLL